MSGGLHKKPAGKRKSRRDFLNLTAKELSAIEDQLESEKLLIQKCRAFAMMCEDPELRKKCEGMAGKHQGHYDRLLEFLK